MKHLIYTCFLLLTLNCAQVSPLTGGYKDTIPPNLINSNPKNLSIQLQINMMMLLNGEEYNGRKHLLMVQLMEFNLYET